MPTTDPLSHLSIADLRLDLERLEREVAVQRVLYRQALVSLQSRCVHPQLLECPYQPGRSVGDGGAMPPIRICCTCGMTEEGWGPGYVVLHDSKQVGTITRSKLYEARRGLMIGDTDKGPIIRRQKTVQQLLVEDDRHLVLEF